MAACFLAIMPEAIFLLGKRPLVSKSNHAERVGLHLKLQIAATATAVAGFAAIYANKTRNDKPHFTSWHGLTGVLLLPVLCIHGVLSYQLRDPSRPAVKRLAAAVSGLRNLYRAHGIASTMLYVCCLGCLLLGLRSTWWEKQVSDPVGWAVLLATCGVGIGVLDQVFGGGRIKIEFSNGPYLCSRSACPLIPAAALMGVVAFAAGYRTSPRRV